jgi:hypothetical protein
VDSTVPGTAPPAAIDATSVPWPLGSWKNAPLASMVFSYVFQAGDPGYIERL